VATVKEEAKINVRFVARTSRIIARLRKILEDYRWGSSSFPLKILMQIFKDL